jgi:carbon-monoxide dehydrogenase medium subunit
VKPASFAYLRPETVEGAVAALAEHDGDVAVLAGGQSLVPMLHMRLMRPAAVIDINRIETLDRIETRGDGIAIGALTRYSTIESSALVAERLPLLQNVVRYVGARWARCRSRASRSTRQSCSRAQRGRAS